MRVGVTGHQRRPNLNWNWVAETIRLELGRLPQPLEAFSCLAGGADQVFAREALAAGGSLVAIVPLDDYERFFEPADLDEYRRLIRRSRVEALHLTDEPEQAFFDAGKYIVDHVQLLMAIWDGAPAKGFGGTADVVAYARDKARTVLHVNPITQKVRSVSAF